MEMDRPSPSMDQRLPSQALEITFEPPQNLDYPKELDVWSMEEGDDSVFYSDEDQTHQDTNPYTSCDFGAIKSKCHENSEAADEPVLQREADPGPQAIIVKENIEKEKEMSPQFLRAEQELQTPETKIMCQPESEESLQPNSANADKQTQSKSISSSDTANVKEEKVLLKTETPNLEPTDKSSEATSTRLNGEEKVLEQMSSAELLTSGNRQLEVDQEPEQVHNFHIPDGCHHGPSPGYSTLPLLKKSSHSASDHNSFDHLTSSKYGTVSYRKIRRGNTRQKIEEFEYKIINM